jgi:VanZ family protein
MAFFPTSPNSDSPTRQPPPARTDLNVYRFAIAILWTVVIMMLCWLPGPMVKELEEGSSWFKIPDLDKMIHAGIFVVFSILWARALTYRRRFAWIALAGFGLAIVTELVQKIPAVGRDGNVADALTDGAGVLVGIVVAPLVEPVARYIESRIFRNNETQPARMDAPTVAVDPAPRTPN